MYRNNKTTLLLNVQTFYNPQTSTSYNNAIQADSKDILFQTRIFLIRLVFSILVKLLVL